MSAVDMDKSQDQETRRIEKAIAINEDFDPALDRRLNRKFDLRILPWLFGIWYSKKPFTLHTPLCTLREFANLFVLFRRLIANLSSHRQALLLHRPQQYRQRPYSRPHRLPFHNYRYSLQHCASCLLYSLHPRRRAVQSAR